jgi:hypothetical protein
MEVARIPDCPKANTAVSEANRRREGVRILNLEF